LLDVVQLMEKRRVKRLPVIQEGRLVGIVSRANLVRALVRSQARSAGSRSKDGRTDRQIRNQILAEMANQAWGPHFAVDGKVEGGVVELYGCITDDRERTALQVLAENVPGVKTVHHHLTWVEPLSGLVIPDDDPGVSARQ